MLTIYTIYDRIAKAMMGGQFALFVFRTDAQAVRYFADAINDERSILSKHPSDYELRAIGTVDDDGLLTENKTTQTIITGDALVAAQTEHTPLTKVS